MENKKGQIAIFVIIALIIVIALVVILLRPRLPLLQQSSLSPETYLKTCIEPSLKENLAILGNQGGYKNPEGFLEYKGEKIKYLCYTTENYKTCVVQQPAIKEQFEKDFSSLIKGRTEICVGELKKEYEKRGYDVNLGKTDSSVSINPGNIQFLVVAPITIKKESTQRFEKFELGFDSQFYDLLLIASSIIEFESSLGDSETTLYMQYYPDLKIEKTKLSDGSKVYKLTNVVSNDSFRFASKSLSWPPGYGV
ncbi:hypothetical protein HYW75_02945 [Candidatus Pacearchaeota archaeon]|nr:hypothetical protein [Candidatus Pacearchaeota archaeon]